MKKLSRQQLIVLIGILMFQIAAGIYFNASGTLFAAIRLEANFPISYMSIYNGTRGAAMAVFAVTVTPLFFRVNKKFFMLASLSVYYLSFLMFFTGQGLPQWITAAVLLALGSCSSSITVPYIINQWMPDFAGTATGMAMACYGVAGAIFNPLVSKWSAASGWRTALTYMAIISVILSVTGLVLIYMRPIPGDTKLKAAKNAFGGGIEAEDRKLFMLMTGCVLAASCTYMFNSYMGTYATGLGYGLAVGGALASINNIGNIIWKILFGIACDKIGPWKPVIFTFAVTVISFAIFAFMGNSLPAIYFASFIYSMCYSAGAIGFSRMCLRAYGVDGFKKYATLHNGINSLAGSLYSFSAAPMIDKMGNYNYLFIVSTVLVVISTLSILTVMKREKTNA